MNIYNDLLDSAARQPLPPMPDIHTKNFEAAKDSAFREDLVPNGGPTFPGPLPGGATGGSPSPRADKATGFDGAGGFCGGSIDFGPKGLQVDHFQCGVTPQFDWEPGKGVGPGIKDGKPGVAYGDGSVTTPGDVTKRAGSSSSASGGKRPEGLYWSRGTRIKGDDLKDLKRDTPPPAAPQINDLGPSTNEPEQPPEQKDEDTAVA
jgi:hypothetical protein